MALQLSETQSTGNSGDYWRIVTCSIDYQNTLAGCTVALYNDQAGRDAGNNPIKYINFNWNSEDFPFDTATLDALNMNPVKKMYDEIKALAPWNGSATDV